MSIRKTIGGDRLGSGKKMTTSLRAYERSTHNLDKVVRLSMTSGTLVPVYVEPILKGDTWEMDISTLVRTHPANGPIYGSWKLQVDVFTADMRLYNKQLHNNLTGVGMNMKDIIFPQLKLKAQNPDARIDEMNQQQISQSSLLAHLGTRGLGTLLVPNGEGAVEITRCAMPTMAYWDTYKEYYANKQEQIGYVIDPEIIEASVYIESMQYNRVVGATVYPYDILSKSYWEEQPNGVIRINDDGYDYIEISGYGITPENITMRWGLRDTLVKPDPEKLIEYGAEGYNYIKEIETFVEGDRTVIILRGIRGSIWGTENDADETVGATTEGEYGGKTPGIRLSQFPLSNIDDMRELVFAQPKTSPLIIGGEGEERRGLPYDATVQTEVIQGKTIMKSKFTMAGLGIKTYQSDRFNNWLSTEWIDRVNNISSVDTSSGSFTMDALNLAGKVYDLMNRIAVSGATYQDWMEAVYGEKVSGAPEMPVYRGGLSSEILFDEVVSSSDATTKGGIDQPLGTLGGRGMQKMVEGGKIRFRVLEHGYVMVIASLTPRIDYSQGNKWWTKLETMDDLHKPQLDGIGFQELTTDEMAAWDTKVDPVTGKEVFFSAGKQPAWMQYMTNWNEIYGSLANKNEEMFMVLNRRYQHNEGGRIEDLTTYIDPTKFNYAFAYVGLENMPFWVQIAIDAEARRKMSAVQIPNL